MPPAHRSIALLKAAESRPSEVHATATDPEGGGLGLDHRPRAFTVGDPDGDRVFEIVCVDASGALLLWRPGELVERIEGEAADGLLPTCVLVAADSSGVVVGHQATRSLRLFRRVGVDDRLAPVESLNLHEIPRALVEIEVDGETLPVTTGDTRGAAFPRIRADNASAATITQLTLARVIAATA